MVYGANMEHNKKIFPKSHGVISFFNVIEITIV